MMKATLFSIFLAITATYTIKIKDPRVTNGEVAQLGQFPWQVGVAAVRSSVLYYCGGSIIGHEWILTAAHCIYEADSVVIFYGTINLEDTNANVTVSEDYIVHENYDNNTLRNDIGLVKLTTSLTYNANVVSILLAPEEMLEVGAEVTVIGWGATSNDDTSEKFDVLRYITVKVIDNEDCVAAYGLDIVQPDIVCTDPGNPVKNPCRGDGGSPAVLYADTKPTHVGIFSFLSNYGCDNPDFPAGFVRTFYHRDWIRLKTGI